MENIDKNITTIEVIGDVLHINYDDTSMEILELSEENYKKMYELWKLLLLFLSSLVISVLQYVFISRITVKKTHACVTKYYRNILRQSRIFFDNYLYLILLHQ